MANGSALPPWLRRFVAPRAPEPLPALPCAGGHRRSTERSFWARSKLPLVQAYVLFAPVGIKRNRSLLEIYIFSKGLKQMEVKGRSFFFLWGVDQKVR